MQKSSREEGMKVHKNQGTKQISLQKGVYTKEARNNARNYARKIARNQSKEYARKVARNMASEYARKVARNNEESILKNELGTWQESTQKQKGTREKSMQENQ